MFGHTEAVVVPPLINNEADSRQSPNDARIMFSHVKDFVIPVTEEFYDLCHEGALSIEVWGHRSLGFSGNSNIITSSSLLLM